MRGTLGIFAGNSDWTAPRWIAAGLLTLLWLCPASSPLQGDEPPQSTAWPWGGWERQSEFVSRWPELDTPHWEAWRQSDPDATWDGTAAVYLAPRSIADQSAPIPKQIDLPRLNNTVLRVWWSPVEGEGDEAAEEQRWSEVEYRRPFVPPFDRSLTLKQSPTTWTIELREAVHREIVASRGVVIIDVVGQPSRSDGPERVRALVGGEIVLMAAKGSVSGTRLQFEPLSHKNTIGYWVDPSDWAAWRFVPSRAGRYRVKLLAGCGSGQGGSQVELVVGEQKLPWTVVETGHFQNFRWWDVGEVELHAERETDLEVRCLRLARSAVMDIRQIRLVPIKDEGSEAARNVWDAAPDVFLPPLTLGPPAPGQRAVVRGDAAAGSAAYHTLTLPTDWRAGERYPVLVEWTGNGPYRNEHGDRITGRVEDAALAHGLAGGDGWIVVSLPFLNGAGTANVRQWWGDAPTYDPGPTQRYAVEALERVCQEWGGDRDAIVLVGFSRGGIACGAVGLSQPQLAAMWRGLVCVSHFEGVRQWPPPSTRTEEVAGRLPLVAEREWFFLAEQPAVSRDGQDAGAAGGDLLEEMRKYLSDVVPLDRMRFMSTGFVNHTDRWSLCPSPARDAVRKWLRSLAPSPR